MLRQLPSHPVTTASFIAAIAAFAAIAAIVVTTAFTGIAAFASLAVVRMTHACQFIGIKQNKNIKSRRYCRHCSLLVAADVFLSTKCLGYNIQ